MEEIVDLGKFTSDGAGASLLWEPIMCGGGGNRKLTAWPVFAVLLEVGGGVVCGFNCLMFSNSSVCARAVVVVESVH